MKTSTKIVFTTLALLITGVTATAAIWHFSYPSKKAVDEFAFKTPDQIRAYLNSDEFKNLDGQARRDARRRAFRQVMDYRANEYFNQPVEKQTVYLDKIIGEMENRRREFEPRRRDPNDPNSRQQRRQARSAENMRARMESVDPETRAKRAAFREALRLRRQRRG